MYFQPSYLPAKIIKALRYFYQAYSTPELKWEEDPLRTMVIIDEIDNFTQKTIQALPRILVSRGQYSINPTGISDNMSEAPLTSFTKGNIHQKRFLSIEGVSQVLIEATNKGTVEKLVDMSSHFLAWASPVIANSEGFKRFGLPMAVSPCTPSRDDTETFQCTLNLPWSREESFVYSEEGKGLSGFNQAFLLS